MEILDFPVRLYDMENSFERFEANENYFFYVIYFSMASVLTEAIKIPETFFNFI